MRLHKHILLLLSPFSKTSFGFQVFQHYTLEKSSLYASLFVLATFFLLNDTTEASFLQRKTVADQDIIPPVTIILTVYSHSSLLCVQLQIRLVALKTVDLRDIVQDAIISDHMRCGYVCTVGVLQGANHSGFPAVVATFSLSARVIVTYLLKDSSFLNYRIIL